MVTLGDFLRVGIKLRNGFLMFDGFKNIFVRKRILEIGIPYIVGQAGDVTEDFWDETALSNLLKAKLFIRSGGAAATDVTPTAVQILAAMGDAVAHTPYASFSFELRNSRTGMWIITAGDGVTIDSGESDTTQITLLPGQSKTVLIVRATSTTVNVYSSGAGTIETYLYGHETFAYPAAPDTTSIVNNQNIVDGEVTKTAADVYLGHPRNLFLTIVDAGTLMTTAIMTVSGLDQNGAAQTEVFNLAVLAAGTHEGAKAWTMIDTVVISSFTGGNADEKISIGVGGLLGLAVGTNATDFLVTHLAVGLTGTAAVNDVIAAQSAANRTVDTTTALANNKVYDAWYRYKVT